MSFELLSLVCAAFVLGGVLKGATGVGAPFIAVPLMAIMVNVPFAVAVFVVPNLVSNAWQVFKYRSDLPEWRFSLQFAIAGAVGAFIGTFALTLFASGVLTTTVALVVLAYVAFRLTTPGWSLTWASARRTVIPFGALGGVFQGAIGLSAPISVTFMSAVGLTRAQFIPIMSLYFLLMAFVQLPTQIGLGVMTWERLLYSCLAVIPLLLGMPIGEYVGKRVSKSTFDRVLLGLLVLLALRLLTLGMF
ncbi:MAG: sulfite exporter TauE/SafE family protein [Pseudomonadota bacterium]